MRRPSRLRWRLMETKPGCFDMKRARSVISDRASACLPGSGSTMVIWVTGWLLVWICGMATSCHSNVADPPVLRSVGLDVVVLDDLEPTFLLALLVGGEVLGRAAQDLHVELLEELLRHVGRAHRLGDLRM